MQESAQPNESNESNKARRRNEDPVERFRNAYEEALAEVKVSADHTLTAGWQALYGAERKQERELRLNLSKRLESVARTLRDQGSSEDIEKSLGEVKRSAEAIRERREHFDQTTVEPVRRCVSAADKAIEDARSQARRLQEEMPLIHKGLDAAMRRAIEQVQRAHWDEDTGTVTIRRPGQSSLN
jgi:hypothetical protein